MMGKQPYAGDTAPTTTTVVTFDCRKHGTVFGNSCPRCQAALPLPPVTITLRDMLACATREVKMRLDVYGRRVRAGKMAQADADAETAKMQAIESLLKRLHEMVPRDIENIIERFVDDGGEYHPMSGGDAAAEAILRLIRTGKP